jgi:UDP-N-acetylmuramate dehydrogenase
MSKHTSWHAGGPADLFFTPRDPMDLPRSCGSCRPRCRCCGSAWAAICWCATAAVRGRGVDAWCVGRLERLSATRMYAEAGVPCARIARQCVKWGLGPAEFFAGIPGTLGGALAMNAGAWGGETWRTWSTSKCLDRGGTRHTRTPAEYDIGYRHVRPRG